MIRIKLTTSDEMDDELCHTLFDLILNFIKTVPSFRLIPKFVHH